MKQRPGNISPNSLAGKFAFLSLRGYFDQRFYVYSIPFKQTLFCLFEKLAWIFSPNPLVLILWQETIVF